MTKEIFIAWSGEPSKTVAEALKGWIPDVIQSVKPWVSTEDIYTGDRWFSEISEKLQDFNFGIFCLTNVNLNNQWIHFESGALAKTVEKSSVCPYLINIKPSDVKGPLSQFQSVEATEEGTLKLLKSINNSLDGEALKEDKLKKSFERWWPELLKILNRLPESDSDPVPERDDKDILLEILDRIRSLSNKQSDKITTQPKASFVSADEHGNINLNDEIELKPY